MVIELLLVKLTKKSNAHGWFTIVIFFMGILPMQYGGT